MSDYLAEIRIKNGRIMRAMRDAGFETQVALADACGAAVAHVGALINFRETPKNTKGQWRPTAVKSAGARRFRPILLTSVTTIAGLLPMALGLSGFSKLWSPFAATICFGILFSTVLTLLVVPAGYVITEDVRAWWQRKRAPAV